MFCNHQNTLKPGDCNLGPTKTSPAENMLYVLLLRRIGCNKYRKICVLLLQQIYHDTHTHIIYMMNV